MTSLDPGIQTLGKWVSDTTLDDVPEGVAATACEVILDTIGVAVRGSTAPEVQNLATAMGSEHGPATVIGTDRRASTGAAALINATSSTWLDFDSGHRHPPGTPLLPAGHMAAHVVPAAITVGESVGATGRATLEAVITGYDVAARIGVSSRLRPGIHPHGTYPTVGAAAAAARLLALDANAISAAIALAMGITLIPTFESGYQGKSVRNVYAGHGANAGILAAHLAQAGITPQRDPIGTIYGSIVSPWHDPDLLLEDLGQRWECTLGYIKPFPSVRYGHPAIEAARTLRLTHSPDPSSIERVLVESYDLPATLSNQDPHTELAAKFSLPWGVAAMLVRGRAGVEEFQALGDTSIRNLSHLVEVVEDPAMTARTPGDRPARITVWMKGEPLAVEVERSAGGPDQPLSRDEITAKFRSLAEPVIGPSAAAGVAQQVLALADLPDVVPLARLLVTDPIRPGAS